MDKKDLLKTAHLAKLHLSEAEYEDTAGDLKTILNHFHKISRVDTTGIRPLTHPLEGVTPPPSPRPDRVCKTRDSDREELLNLTEERVGAEHKVPVVVR